MLIYAITFSTQIPLTPNRDAVCPINKHIYSLSHFIITTIQRAGDKKTGRLREASILSNMTQSLTLGTSKL